MIARISMVVILLITLPAIANADEQITYAPSKVVYDISTPDPEALGFILDRVNMLQNVYQNDSFEASIVLVIHEGAIPLFGANAKTLQPELMQRARGLSMGEIIKFRVCKASAAMQGFKKNDLQDFVVMVPMADAEIVKLQQEGYATSGKVYRHPYLERQ